MILLDHQAKPSFVGFAAEEAYLNQVDQVQIFINGSVLSKHTYPVQLFIRRRTQNTARRWHLIAHKTKVVHPRMDFFVRKFLASRSHAQTVTKRILKKKGAGRFVGRRQLASARQYCVHVRRVLVVGVSCHC